TGWRAHRLRYFPRGTQVHFFADDRDSPAHGVFPLDGLVGLGNSAAIEQFPASAGDGMAPRFWPARLAGDICRRYAGTHPDPITVFTCVHSGFRATGPGAVARQVGKRQNVLAPAQILSYTPLFNRFN